MERWMWCSRRRASFSDSDDRWCPDGVLTSFPRDEVADLDERARALGGVGAVARQPGAGRHVAVLLPCEQDRMGVDRVLAAGVDLEVHVRRRRLGVAGVAGEAENGAGLDLAAVDRVG